MARCLRCKAGNEWIARDRLEIAEDSETSTAEASAGVVRAAEKAVVQAAEEYRAPFPDDEHGEKGHDLFLRERALDAALRAERERADESRRNCVHVSNALVRITTALGTKCTEAGEENSLQAVSVREIARLKAAEAALAEEKRKHDLLLNAHADTLLVHARGIESMTAELAEARERITGLSIDLADERVECAKRHDIIYECRDELALTAKALEAFCDPSGTRIHEQAKRAVSRVTALSDQLAEVRSRMLPSDARERIARAALETPEWLGSGGTVRDRERAANAIADAVLAALKVKP